MKLALAFALFLVVAPVSAEMVNGYFRADGTYVAPYYRTPADGNPYNNLTPPPQNYTPPPRTSSYGTPPSTYQPSTPRYPSYPLPQPCWAGTHC